jgi:hypothetical protein
VKYFWPDYYVKMTYPDGRTLHSDPWRTFEAAEYALRVLQERWEYDHRRR